ncbi:MAG: 2-oxoacid:acceptor oxidoreductase family protein [Chloroflexi bacterium]|nr:2-oxoacid:acceptor oxidoreductase family protein [Chloroflexota bacterium]
MYQEIVFAGFGGQGVLFAAQVLAYSAMKQGNEVAWVPSYGPEMRGGTASAGVIIADEEIGSLTIAEPNVAAVMNPPSLDKFESAVLPGGTLVVNRSLIDRRVHRTDINLVEVPANDVAGEMGNDRLANVVVLGAVVAAIGVVSVENVVAALEKSLSGKKAHLLPANEAALRRGMAFTSAFLR